MSWDAKGFDKPLILLDNSYVKEAVENNKYKLVDDFQEAAGAHPSTEAFIDYLAKNEKFKDACDYYAYSVARRARVWWACLCVLNMLEEVHAAAKGNAEKVELEQKKRAAMLNVDKSAVANARKKLADMKAKLGQMESDLKSKTFSNPVDPMAKLQKQMMAPVDNPDLNKFFSEYDNMVSNLSPEAKMDLDARMAQTKEAFVLKYGKSFEDSVKEIVFSTLNRTKDKDAANDAMSASMSQLNSKMDGVKSHIKEKMSVFPVKLPGMPKSKSKEKAGDALDAAIRWVIAPTDINAELALAAGRAANGTPGGMVALSAFWSGNNLAPKSKQIIVPPPGLSSKGCAAAVFMCAMAKGGDKSFDERYSIYFNLGTEVAQGINTWDGSAFEKVVKDDEHKWEGHAGFGRDKETANADDNLNF